MLVKEIKALLDKNNIPYKSSMNKPELEALLKEPAEAEDSVVEEEKVEKPVIFEGRQVVKVLTKGHTKTHFHCKMEGGITQHVPKNKFNG